MNEIQQAGGAAFMCDNDSGTNRDVCIWTLSIAFHTKRRRRLENIVADDLS